VVLDDQHIGLCGNQHAIDDSGRLCRPTLSVRTGSHGAPALRCIALRVQGITTTAATAASLAERPVTAQQRPLHSAPRQQPPELTMNPRHTTSPLSQRPIRSRLAAAASLAVVLSACGGSDGSAPVITAQPQDVSVAEGGSASASVTATSDAGDLGYQWFDVTADADIADATASSMSFEAVALTANNTQFNVRVRNDEGSTTSSNATLRVVERSWSTPAEALASRTRQTALVVDSHGHTHLLAVTGNNLAAGIEARLKLAHADATQANDFTVPAGGALQASEALSPASTSVAAAANGSGHVLAVWHRNGIIGGALYTPGPDAATAGTWTLLPTRINSFMSTSALDPAVTPVGDDAFEIVWREREAPSGAHDVMARTFTVANNTLGAPVGIETQPGETSAPRLVSDAAGNVLAAWSHSGLGVLVNRRITGQAWGTDLTNVDSSGLPLEVLRTNAAGRAVTLSSDRLGQVQAALLDLGASQVMQLAALPVANAYGSPPDALVDADGRIHVFGVSVDSGDGSSRLYRWLYTPTGGWGTAEAISDVVTTNFLTTGLGLRHPQVSALDAQGNFIVAWQDLIASGDDPLSHVNARRFHAGLNGWRATVALGDGYNNVPRAAMARDGRATVVFGHPADPAMQAASFR
jgi:hypothetical protein